MLGDIAHTQTGIFRLLPKDFDGASIRGQQSEHEFNEGGFTAAIGPHNANGIQGPDIKLYIGENQPLLIAEVNPF